MLWWKWNNDNSESNVLKNEELLKEKEMMVFCSPLMELLPAESALGLKPLKWNTGKANCGPFRNPASWFINNDNNKKSNNNNNFDNNNNL